MIDDKNLHLLLDKVGIDKTQINTTNVVPGFFAPMVEDVKKDIIHKLSTVANYTYYIESHKLKDLFSAYDVKATNRKTKYQLGICRHIRKEITINLGYYHNMEIDKDEVFQTLVHEFVHGIVFHIYSQSGHNKLFHSLMYILTGEFR